MAVRAIFVLVFVSGCTLQSMERLIDKNGPDAGDADPSFADASVFDAGAIDDCSLERFRPNLAALPIDQFIASEDYRAVYSSLDEWYYVLESDSVAKDCFLYRTQIHLFGPGVSDLGMPMEPRIDIRVRVKNCCSEEVTTSAFVIPRLSQFDEDSEARVYT